MAHFLSFFLFTFLFFLVLAPKSDVSKPPTPPLSSPTFRFISPSSDLGSYGWDLLKALGGSSFHRTFSLLSTRLFLSSGCQDLLWPWMFGEQRIWGFFLVRDSIVFPIFGLDSTKLFFLKAPTTPKSHGISCHGQLDSTQWFAWLGSRIQTFCCFGHR